METDDVEDELLLVPGRFSIAHNRIIVQCIGMINQLVVQSLALESDFNYIVYYILYIVLHLCSAQSTAQ